MKPASVSFVGSLPVLALLVSGMAMAGGGHNSTSPAMGTVQLASILCNVSSGSSPQGYVRNNSLNGVSGAAHLRRSGLCQSLAAHHPAQNHKGKHKAIDRHYGREASRTPSHNRVATNAVGQHTNSRDSFKQETWFMPDGSKQRRVTKHQARKQGWTGPEAMQAAHQSHLDANPPTPAIPTDEPLMAPLQSSDSPPDSGESVSRLSPAATASLVTDGAAYDGVETGLYERQGLAPVPFKMVRNHGVIAIPQFEPGSDSAVASAEPTILVKKFRMIDGAMQPDNSFSDDGMEDFAVPLPAGDRVTAFTLDKDKLVVLSRPEADQGLSRVTLIDIDESDDVEMIDGGASSGLWVKGELFRFHNNALYTLSQKEQKLFIYPDLASDSSQSLSSVRVVDLSSVGLSDGELLSALADGARCHVAVRRPDPESDAHRIHLYQIDDAGALTKETVVTDLGNQDASCQLHLREGEPVLVRLPSGGSGIDNLAFSDSTNKALDGHQFGKTIQKRSSLGGEDTRYGSRLRANREAYDPIGCNTPVEYGLTCENERFREDSCEKAPPYFHRIQAGTCINPNSNVTNGACNFTFNLQAYSPDSSCVLAGATEEVTCPGCTANITYEMAAFNSDCSIKAGGVGTKRYCSPAGCIPGCSRPAAGSGAGSGLYAGLIAVSTGLSTVFLTAGFMDYEGKEESSDDAPME